MWWPNFYQKPKSLLWNELCWKVPPNVYCTKLLPHLRQQQSCVAAQTTKFSSMPWGHQRLWTLPCWNLYSVKLLNWAFCSSWGGIYTCTNKNTLPSDWKTISDSPRSSSQPVSDLTYSLKNVTHLCCSFLFKYQISPLLFLLLFSLLYFDTLFSNMFLPPSSSSPKTSLSHFNTGGPI